MDEKKVDRRVRRTKRQLRMALTTLMLEKSVNDITVHEITELADVNRGTFYSHYKDVGDLLNQLEEGVFDSLTIVCQKHEPINQNSNLKQFLEEIFTLVYENSDVCKAMLCNDGDYPFKRRLFDALYDQFYKKYIESLCDCTGYKVEGFCSFIISGSLASVSLWLKDGMPFPPEDLARMIETYMMQGISAVKK